MKGHQTSWESQPLVNNKPAGNMMVATAIILSGETFSRVSHFAEILSLKFIGSTQFYSLQKDVAIPAIDRYYTMQRDVILQQLHGKHLILGGDGRCDSPGFSAKYCTYTFMDSATSSIKKKILAIKPKKLLNEVKPWIPSICNHIWYCSRQADGDPDKLEETWRSLLFHISNRHTFPGKIVTQCGHPPLSPDDIRKKKWLNQDSQVYAALEKVVTDKLILRDIRQLDLFCHTGALETYHSMMLKYCPKRIEFEYASMVAH
ncbi:uncharacterized protein LOC127713955 [Mytilus californianus]|uniref:uncharacterized protein LOC127713955 n=1 Tax=Mytilus californianus TaxID=6549 RepID=UPI002245AC93|nr:uncharacterized protein LOC127713955 [Mytilus californianus]